jgi:hypothetical protein
MMAQRVAIFDVVVDEREIMDELNGDGCWQNLLKLIGWLIRGACSRLSREARLMCQQKQRRAQELAQVSGRIALNRAEVSMCPAQVIAHLAVKGGKHLYLTALLGLVKKPPQFIAHQQAIFA